MKSARDADINRIPQDVKWDYYIECMKNEVERMVIRSNSLFGSPENKMLSIYHQRIDTLSKMKNNEAITWEEKDQLLDMPYFNGKKEVEDYPVTTPSLTP